MRLQKITIHWTEFFCKSISTPQSPAHTVDARYFYVNVRLVFCFAKSGLCQYVKIVVLVYFSLTKLINFHDQLKFRINVNTLQCKIVSHCKKLLNGGRNESYFMTSFMNDGFLTMATSSESGCTRLPLYSAATGALVTRVAHAQLLVGRPGRDLTNVVFELDDVEQNWGKKHEWNEKEMESFFELTIAYMGFHI